MEENEDFLDCIDEIIEENTYSEVDENLVEAKKFLSLMETFDVKNGSNMEENLRKNKQEILKQRIEIKDSETLNEVTTSIVESEELLQDFILIKETLREDIRNTRVILEKFSEDLSNTSMEDMNGQVVLAFSEIKKSNIKSMELLIDSYEKVAKTQLSVKKLTKELKVQDNKDSTGTIINNAVFVGSSKELLDSL